MNKTGTQRIETHRLILRPFRMEDAEDMYANWASDPEVTRFLTWPTHPSVDVTRHVISGWVSRYDQGDYFNWAIEWKETGEAIGAMGYGPSCQCNLPAREGEPLIGYWVARPYWNQGICTEALRMMLDRIRKTTEIKSLISGHFIDNPASGRVMEKCGFIPTGETVVDPEQGRDTPIRVLRLEL